MLIHAALENDPEKRFANAQEMLTALEQIQNGEFCTVCTRTAIKSWNTVFLRWLDWNPYIVVPVIVALFAIIIAVAAYIGYLIGSS